MQTSKKNYFKKEMVGKKYYIAPELTFLSNKQNSILAIYILLLNKNVKRH